MSEKLNTSGYSSVHVSIRYFTGKTKQTAPHLNNCITFFLVKPNCVCIFHTLSSLLFSFIYSTLLYSTPSPGLHSSLISLFILFSTLLSSFWSPFPSFSLPLSSLYQSLYLALFFPSPVPPSPLSLPPLLLTFVTFISITPSLLISLAPFPPPPLLRIRIS